MTEIPEHLLKRSKERRAAMGLPGGETDASTSAETPATPAPAAASSAVAARAATPEPAPPPPPKPEAPYVAAANARRRIPFWAMPVIALLPVWGLLYWNSVRVPPVHDVELIEGATVYTEQCSSCHGAIGQGVPGPQLNGGEVLKTFKNPLDMMMWIYLGKEGGARADGSYGDCDRPGGAHNVSAFPGLAMPAHENMTASDLADVTRYIRETLSGETPSTPAQQANYPTLAQQAITMAQAGKLPSADTLKAGASTCAGGSASAAGSTSATTTSASGTATTAPASGTATTSTVASGTATTAPASGTATTTTVAAAGGTTTTVAVGTATTTPGGAATTTTKPAG